VTTSDHGTTSLTSTLLLCVAAGRDRVLSDPMKQGLDAPERRCIVNWTLEVVVVPVSDVDRAKAFYVDQG
jgi:hypothetical protein